MGETTAGFRRIASILLGVVLLMGVTGSAAVAGAGGSERSVSLSAALGVHGFTGDQMQGAYGQIFGGNFQVSPRTARRVEWRLETSLWIAVGDPAIPDTTWTVESSAM